MLQNLNTADRRDGRMPCPICKGKGHVTENAEQFEFHTRDPQTSECLICAGTGRIGPRKKLPDGRAIHEVLGTHKAEAIGMPNAEGLHPAPADEPVDGIDIGIPNHRLNVSRKVGADLRVCPKNDTPAPAPTLQPVSPGAPDIAIGRNDEGWCIMIEEKDPAFLPLLCELKHLRKKENAWTGSSDILFSAMVSEVNENLWNKIKQLKEATNG